MYTPLPHMCAIPVCARASLLAPLAQVDRRKKQLVLQMLSPPRSMNLQGRASSPGADPNRRKKAPIQDRRTKLEAARRHGALLITSHTTLRFAPPGANRTGPDRRLVMRRSPPPALVVTPPWWCASLDPRQIAKLKVKREIKKKKQQRKMIEDSPLAIYIEKKEFKTENSYYSYTLVIERQNYPGPVHSLPMPAVVVTTASAGARRLSPAAVSRR